MLATRVLLLLTIAFFEAVSRFGTPREARLPLRSLTARDHLVAAWAGLVLLTRTHERVARDLDAVTGSGWDGRRHGRTDHPAEPCTGARC